MSIWGDWDYSPVSFSTLLLSWVCLALIGGFVICSPHFICPRVRLGVCPPLPDQGDLVHARSGSEGEVETIRSQVSLSGEGKVLRLTSWLHVVEIVWPRLIFSSQCSHPICPELFLASHYPASNAVRRHASHSEEFQITHVDTPSSRRWGRTLLKCGRAHRHHPRGTDGAAQPQRGHAPRHTFQLPGSVSRLPVPHWIPWSRRV